MPPPSQTGHLGAPFLEQPSSRFPRYVTRSLPAFNGAPTRSPPPTHLMMMPFLAFASVIHLFPSLALAQHNPGRSGVESGTVTTYLNLTPGKSVLFGPWIPKQIGRSLGHA